MKPQWHIGTSGWSYDNWKHRFYPKGHLSSSKHLPYYASQFSTAEVNSTFYRIIGEKVSLGWYDKTPENFIFVLKMHQYLTHSKRLKIDENAENRFNMFLKTLNNLGHKAGPILVQLPPNMKQDTERLKHWLEQMPRYRYAFEFRHESWFNMKTYQLLSDFNAALVYSDSPHVESRLEITGDFFYGRLHGPGELYKSKYNSEDLQNLVQQIKSSKGFDKCKEAFVYFNNDYKAYAIENARELIRITGNED